MTTFLHVMVALSYVAVFVGGLLLGRKTQVGRIVGQVGDAAEAVAKDVGKVGQ